MHELCVPHQVSAFEAYQTMTSNSDLLIHLAFCVRDFLCRFVGLAPIHGFSTSHEDKLPLPGGKLDFFNVEDISEEMLLLSNEDRHLRVSVLLKAVPEFQGQTLLRIATKVYNHNLLGRIYMLPVAPMHRVVLRRLLTKLT